MNHFQMISAAYSLYFSSHINHRLHQTLFTRGIPASKTAVHTCTLSTWLFLSGGGEHLVSALAPAAVSSWQSVLRWWCCGDRQRYQYQFLLLFLDGCLLSVVCRITHDWVPLSKWLWVECLVLARHRPLKLTAFWGPQCPCLDCSPRAFGVLPVVDQCISGGSTPLSGCSLLCGFLTKNVSTNNPK